MRLSLVTVCLFLLGIGAIAAPKDSIVQVVQLTPRELVLVTTASQLRYREDLSAPPEQVRIEIFNVRPTEATREINFPKGSAFASLFIRNKAGNALAIIERSTPRQGHVIATLPYSRSLYIRGVEWNSSTDCLIGWGIAAWATEQYASALRFWRTALARGVSDAAVWLGIAAAVQQQYNQTLDYLEPLSRRTDVIPDMHAALAAAYRARGDNERSLYHEKLFAQQIGRPPASLSPLVIPSDQAENNTPTLLEVFEQHELPQDTQRLTVQPPVSPSPQASADTDLFAQLRQFQNRNARDSAISTSETSPAQNSLATLLTIGGALLLFGLVLLRSYLRWRKQHIQTMAAAIAAQHSTPSDQSPPPEPTTFDQLISFEAAKNSAYAEPPSPSTPRKEIEEESTLFDFDEEIYRQHEARTQAPHPTIDERLFYHSDTEPQLSQEPPSNVAPELSEQERDLLRVLERISKQYDDNSQ